MLETATRPDPDVTSAVAQRWAYVDPLSAADWSIGLENADSRSAAVSASIGAWIQGDTDAAERWVLSLPNGDDKDVAIGAALAFSVNLPRFDYRTLAEEFTSQSARTRALRDVASAFRASANAQGIDVTELVQAQVLDPRISEIIQAELNSSGSD